MSIIRRSYYGHDPFADHWNNSYQNHHYSSSLSGTSPPRRSTSLLPQPRRSPPPPHHAPLPIEETSHTTTEAIEWKETPTVHIFKVDLHGLKKEDVKLEVENGRVLKIIGEKVFEKENKTDDYFYVERSTGTYIRSLVLPADAKPHKAEACFENGALIITVPKEIRSTRPEVTRIPLF